MMGLVPAAPTPGERADPIHRAVQAYAEEQPRLLEVTDRWAALITRLLDDAGINYLSISARTKSVASYAAKAIRYAEERPGEDDPFEAITDQVGVRVITYLLSDVDAVADLLADQLAVLDDRDMGQETAAKGRFGYASRHLLLDARPGRGEAPMLRPASVQVRTVLQHAWAEFEHDIRYKGTVPEEHVPDLDRRFTLAAGLLELADREFTEIRDRIQAGVAREERGEDPRDPRLDASDLAAFLSARFADAGWSRTDHYAWISGLLLELGITSMAELDALLGSVDDATIEARLAYKYPAGAVRRLDDALLSLFGRRYVELHGNAHRVDLLSARLEKLRAEAPPE
ncbi:MAG: (p)ppGpp synthetase [Nocardioidaceae bacterium]|nr:(p)ppGpp synthetase [Nocardioidaceae bacterium]